MNRPSRAGRVSARVPMSVWSIAIALALVLTIGAASGLIPRPIGWVAVSGPFLFLILRRPILRRVAFRSLARRPQEAVLIVLGALLGTAMITGGFLIQDSLSASVVARVGTQVGSVDEVVAAPGAHAASEVVANLTTQRPGGVSAVLPMITLGAPVFTTGQDPRAQPHGHVIEVDFAAARAFGNNPSASGISGSTPTGTDAAVSSSLASTLRVRTGAMIRITAYGQERAFRVSEVLPQRGIAGFGTSIDSVPANVFLPPGTLEAIRLTTGSSRLTSDLSTSVVAVHNSTVARGAAAADSVTGGLRSALAGSPAVVTRLRADLEAVSAASATAATSLVSIATAMCAIAGILLLINTFVMLATERRRQSGMLRAIGMRRSELVGAFAIEGWLYAVVSAALGIAVGIGVAWLGVRIMSSVLAGRAGASGSTLQVSISASTLMRAFTLGLVLALATVVATAVWASRLNVIRAIRDLSEPNRFAASDRLWLFGAGIATLGALGTALGAASSAAALLLLAPAVFAFGLFLVSTHFGVRRRAATVLAVSVIVWEIEASTLATHAFRNPGTAVYILQAVVLAAAGVSVFGIHQTQLAAVLGGGGRHPRLAIRLGLAYPLARKGRTAMVLGIFVLEVMMLALALGIGSVNSSQVSQTAHRLGTGATIRVSSSESAPILAPQLKAVPGVTKVTVLRTVSAGVALTAHGQRLAVVPLAGSARTIWGNGAPPLGTRDPRYPNDAAVYQAVQTNPDLIIVSHDFLADLPSAFLAGVPHTPGQASPGQQIWLRSPSTDTVRQVTIVGVQGDIPGTAPVFDYVASTTVDELTGRAATENLSFVDTGPGVDPHVVADVINGRFARVGADAASFRDIATRSLGDRSRYFEFLAGLVTIGVLIGVLALSVVMIRSVRERRRQIGTLRAIGWTTAGVRRVFLAEAGVLATQGTLLGICLGTALAYRISNGTAASSFSVPWVSLLAVTVVTIVVSLAASARAANVASRIPPAAALRSIE